MFNTGQESVGGWTPQEMLEYVKNNLKDDELAAITKKINQPANVSAQPTGDGQVPIWSSSANQWVAATGVAQSGTINMYGGNTIPTGWVLCDGTAISRTLFAPLFTAIGTVWGIGDGSTTFNLPDLLGRVPVGTGAGSGLTARTLGSSSGVESQNITVANLPSHNHGTGGGATVTSGAGSAHSHGQPSGQYFTGGTTPTNPTDRIMAGNAGGTTAGVPFTTQFTNNESAHTHVITMVAQGSGTGHNNMQPYAVVTFIIKL